MKPWLLLDSELVVDRPWLRLHRERLELANGSAIEFHRVEAPDWVAVVTLTDAGELVLVDQYRRGLDGVSRELPAGGIEPGESPLAAAQRELREETGYASTQWTALATVLPEPFRGTARAHLFVARGARRVAEQQLDPTEALTVHLVPVAEALAAAGAGGLVHGTHVGALLLAERRGLLRLGP